MSPEETDAIGDLLNSWLEAHNQRLELKTANGDTAALTYAACCVSLANRLGISHLPQIQQLRRNLGLVGGADA